MKRKKKKKKKIHEGYVVWFCVCVPAYISSSCHAVSTDIPDSLLLLLPIIEDPQDI